MYTRIDDPAAYSSLCRHRRVASSTRVVSCCDPATLSSVAREIWTASAGTACESAPATGVAQYARAAAWQHQAGQGASGRQSGRRQAAPTEGVGRGGPRRKRRPRTRRAHRTGSVGRLTQIRGQCCRSSRWRRQRTVLRPGVPTGRASRAGVSLGAPAAGRFGVGSAASVERSGGRKTPPFASHRQPDRCRHDPPGLPLVIVPPGRHARRQRGRGTA